MTIFGWDASDFDWSRGTMDLGAAARDGISWMTHKASEGTSVRHMRYGAAMSRARDAGIPVLGAYHVVRSPANAAAEVDYHLATVNAATPWWRDWPHWFFQVDLEKWPYDAVSAFEGESFADILAQRTGRLVVIYASAGQYGNDLAGSNHSLWNANYPLWDAKAGKSAPAPYRKAYAAAGGDNGPGWKPYSGQTPIFWQYSDNATIGNQPGCDANAHRGSLEQLLALTKGDTAMPMETDDPKAWRALAGAGEMAAYLRDGNETTWDNKPVQAVKLLHQIASGVAALTAGTPTSGLDETQWRQHVTTALDNIAAAQGRLLTADQITALGAQVSAAVVAAHSGLTDADKPVIEDAVMAGVRAVLHGA